MAAAAAAAVMRRRKQAQCWIDSINQLTRRSLYPFPRPYVYIE